MGLGNRGDFTRRPEAVHAIMILAFGCFFGLKHLEERQWGPVDLEHMVAGTALTPMQYRVLLPWLYRVLHASPVPMLQGISLHRYSQLIEVSSVVCLLLASRWLLRRVGLTPSESLCGSWLTALLLPFHYLLPEHSYYYIYDIPAVLFFTIGLGLLVDRNWAWFYPLFAVATVNRETVCFLTLIYVLAAFRRDNFRSIATHVIAQACIWVTIKATLLYAYRANAQPAYGAQFGLFKNSLASNLEFLGQFGTPDLLVASMFAFLWIPVFALWAWIPHPFVRRAVVAVPIFIVAMLYVGEVEELRIFGEMIPVVAAATVLLVRQACAGRTGQGLQQT